MVDHSHLPDESLVMPVTGVSVDYASGHQVPAHSHPYAQLIYAISGVLLVETAAGRWVIPPTRGVWVQAGVEHSLCIRGKACMRSLFVNPEAVDGLPTGNCVIDVSPLLRELILAATQVPATYSADSRNGRLMRFLLDELRSLPVLPFHLPWPEDERIARVCLALAQNPAQADGAEHWATQLAMSPKTFHRRFLSSTGITFGRCANRRACCSRSKHWPKARRCCKWPCSMATRAKAPLPQRSDGSSALRLRASTNDCGRRPRASEAGSRLSPEGRGVTFVRLRISTCP